MPENGSALFFPTCYQIGKGKFKQREKQKAPEAFASGAFFSAQQSWLFLFSAAVSEISTHAEETEAEEQEAGRLGHRSSRRDRRVEIGLGDEVCNTDRKKAVGLTNIGNETCGPGDIG